MKPRRSSSKTRRPSPDTGREEAERWIYGRHAVAAALANPQRRWYRLAALVGHEQEARALVDRARARQLGDGDAIRVLDRHHFVEILPDGAVHQGLALAVEPLATPDLADLVQSAEAATTRSVIVVLDGVSDPHNLGAVMRSAGAFESVPLSRVVNLVRALEQLKKAGFWICGLDETAPHMLTALDLGQRI